MRSLRNLVTICVALVWAGCVAEDAEHPDYDTELLPQVSARDGGQKSVDAGTEGSSLGGTCSKDADCSGASARCLTNVMSLPIPGGICTASCKNDRQCGGGAGCPFAAMVDLARRFLPDAGITDSLSVCMKQCSSATDCRAGYTCAAMPSLPLVPTSTVKYCLPPMPDGGLPRPDGGLPAGFPGIPRVP